MGWFSDFFGGVDTSSWLGAGATLGGALIAGSANRSAAREAERASERALERLDPFIADSEPARRRLVELTRPDPAMLTPGQRLQLEDLVRSAESGAAAGGLRGAGRTRLALLDQIERRARAGFQDQNVRRADEASRLLAGQGLSAAGAAAGTEVGTADILGNAATATGSVYADTLGSLAGILADDAKRRGREKRFVSGTPWLDSV